MVNSKYVDGLELRIKELNKKLSDEADAALHLIAENKSLKAEREALAAQVGWLQSVAEELRLKLDAEEEKTNTLKEYIDKVVKQSKIAIRQCSRKDFYIDEIENLDEVIDFNPLRVNHILMEKRVVFHEN